MADHEEYEEYEEDEYPYDQDHFSNAMNDYTDEQAQATAAYQAWGYHPTGSEWAEAQAAPSAYDAGETSEDTANAVTYTGNQVQGP